MNDLELLQARAEFALIFIMRVQSACDAELRGQFRRAERAQSSNRRLSSDIGFANSTVEHVVQSDPDADSGAGLCYDFLTEAIKTPTPSDPSLQTDLCDSLVALGELQALAVEDVIGDGKFEPVEYFRKYLTNDAGKEARKALEKSGGPMADLLL